MKGFVVALNYLVREQGISSRSYIDLKIQDYYFYFLFTQVTLVVSLSAGLTAIANEMVHGASLAPTLARNLPKASNYFLSYILLQGLSISANSLLRIDCLIGRFILGPIFDKSVTQMMTRRRGQDLEWGTFVPVFTNLSCIGRFEILEAPSAVYAKPDRISLCYHLTNHYSFPGSHNRPVLDNLLRIKYTTHRTRWWGALLSQSTQTSLDRLVHDASLSHSPVSSCTRLARQG
jgi:hypothetical protein